MLARTIARPFDSADHLFEPAWGGRRVLAFIGPAEHEGAGGVESIDAGGTAIRPVPPELDGLGVRVAARSCFSLSAKCGTGDSDHAVAHF